MISAIFWGGIGFAAGAVVSIVAPKAWARWQGKVRKVVYEVKEEIAERT